MRLKMGSRVSMIVTTFLIGIPHSRAQVNEATDNTRIWFASFLSGNAALPGQSGSLFRESVGAGLSRPLSHSWSLSPSLWYYAKETPQAATADIEGHLTLAWHRSLEAHSYVYSGTTIELASNMPYPLLLLRAEIGGQSVFRRQVITPFISWEGAYRTDGEYTDKLRVRAGARFRVWVRLEIVPMFSRRERVNGAALLFVYDVPRRCFP